MTEAKKQPDKQRLAKEKVKREEMRDDAILFEARSWQKKGKPIANAKDIADAIKESKGLEVNVKQVRQVLRSKLGLSFIKTKKVHPNANSVKVLV